MSKNHSKYNLCNVNNPVKAAFSDKEQNVILNISVFSESL